MRNSRCSLSLTLMFLTRLPSKLLVLGVRLVKRARLPGAHGVLAVQARIPMNSALRGSISVARRKFHAAQYYRDNPVLKPDKPWEATGARRRQAMAFSDGVWYDPQAHLFKAWYVSGPATLYATSKDGVHWEKPPLDVEPGTNIVHKARRDSSTVWMDLEEKDPRRRYKFVYSNGQGKPVSLYYSADGIHWGSEIARSLPAGDRTTAFWKAWTSLRT